jgi:DNA-binding winged helix-turn-helix (wHTH) protein
VIVRFSNCELDLARVVFRRDGMEMHIEPLTFNVLSYLIERRGQVVRKVDLLDHVWGDRFVSESALTTQIKSVRQAVGDDGSQQRIIRTVHGKGYEFVADVHVMGDDHGSDALPDEVTATPGSRLPAAVQSLIGRDELLELLTEKLATNSPDASPPTTRTGYSSSNWSRSSMRVRPSRRSPPHST